MLMLNPCVLAKGRTLSRHSKSQYCHLIVSKLNSRIHFFSSSMFIDVSSLELAYNSIVFGGFAITIVYLVDFFVTTSFGLLDNIPDSQCAAFANMACNIAQSIFVHSMKHKD